MGPFRSAPTSNIETDNRNTQYRRYIALPDNETDDSENGGSSSTPATSVLPQQHANCVKDESGHTGTLPTQSDEGDIEARITSSSPNIERECKNIEDMSDNKKLLCADGQSGEGGSVDTIDCFEERNEAELDIRILDLYGKHQTIKCRSDWKIQNIKDRVADIFNVPLASQRLIYQGHILEDERQLAFYKLESGHTIHLFIRSTAAAGNDEQNDANSESMDRSLRGGVAPVTIVHIPGDPISAAVFPSDSALRTDPLVLDSPLGNFARRVKLWSSFILIIHTMRVMSLFAILANEQQIRRQQASVGAASTQKFSHGMYEQQDSLVIGIELVVHIFAVYVGCVGFKAVHDTDIRPIRFYCRGIVWVAIMTVIDQIYATYKIYTTPVEHLHFKNAQYAPSIDDLVSANIFQTIMLVLMWIIAIHHAYVHQLEVVRHNASVAAAAMNAFPPP